VLENKSSNAVTWKDKKKTWGEIAVLYNSQSLRSVRIHHIFVQLVISRQVFNLFYSNSQEVQVA